MCMCVSTVACIFLFWDPIFMPRLIRGRLFNCNMFIVK